MGDDKNKNMMLLLYMIIINFCILIIVASCTFNTFKNGKYIEWIVMIVTLLGAVLSGILTMASVILTLNRTIETENRQIKKRKEENKERLKKIAYYLYMETHKYIFSVSSYLETCINMKLYKGDECINLKFYKEYFNNIYLVSDKFIEYTGELAEKNLNELGIEDNKFCKLVINTLLDIAQIKTKMYHINKNDLAECEMLFEEITLNCLSEELNKYKNYILVLDEFVESKDEDRLKIKEISNRSLYDIINCAPEYEKTLYYLKLLYRGEFDTIKDDIAHEEV